jgi:diguanylate cyclase (GGDEF)-like protein
VQSVVFLLLAIINFYYTYDLFILSGSAKKKIKTAERKMELLKNTAEKDHLTGVNNRRAFDEYYEFVYEKSKIDNEHFFVVFFDIDHFKNFNDAYGHESGDRVLAKFANTISKNIRKDGDAFFRYGGEEFVLVSTGLPRSPLHEARFLTKKLKDSVEKIRIDGLPKITCSMGVGFFETDKSKEKILKEADDNVYIAKESGRNRACITKDIIVF